MTRHHVERTGFRGIVGVLRRTGINLAAEIGEILTHRIRPRYCEHGIAERRGDADRRGAVFENTETGRTIIIRAVKTAEIRVAIGSLHRVGSYREVFSRVEIGRRLPCTLQRAVVGRKREFQIIRRNLHCLPVGTRCGLALRCGNHRVKPDARKDAPFAVA